MTTAPAARRTATFADTGEALVNPGMGFTHYEYSNQPETYGARLDYGDTLEDFPGLTTVYLRLAWGLLEPAEGRYDWSWFDGPAQRWLARGKRLCLRLTTSESFNRYATPKWVYDAGARAVPFVGRITDKYSGGPSWEPDFGDPVYLAKLDAFLAAAAARYDGDPHVDFVDVGTFGMWGEGHTWHGSHTRYPYATIAKHLELHARHFRRTRLVVNDNQLDQDYAHPELLQYCLAQRMGVRNDSVCCLGPDTPFRDITLHLARAFWLTAPVVVETGHYGQTNRMGAWRTEHVLRAVRELHASYCSIHWWPREFLAAERPLVDEINCILGYRLVPREATWPERIVAGEPWSFTARWANVGVAPLYEDAFPALTLKDADGGIAAVYVDEGTNLRRVLPACLGGSSPIRYEQQSVFCAAPAWARAARAALPDHGLTPEDLSAFAARSATLRPGVYDLYLSAGSRMGTPRLALPLAGHDGHRRYRLGPLAFGTAGD